MASTLKLKTSDDEMFEISFAAAKLSKLLETMIPEEEDDDTEIPIQTTARTLTKVLEFCNHYVDAPFDAIEQPLKSNDMANIVPTWYVDFLSSMDKEQLTLVAIASNYMDIPALLDLCCAKVAATIKGKTPEAIRSALNLVNEFSPEEKARLKSENKWIAEPNE
jgi:S-phase kinase-associated protein 1